MLFRATPAQLNLGHGADRFCAVQVEGRGFESFQLHATHFQCNTGVSNRRHRSEVGQNVVSGDGGESNQTGTQRSRDRGQANRQPDLLMRWFESREYGWIASLIAQSRQMRCHAPFFRTPRRT